MCGLLRILDFLDTSEVSLRPPQPHSQEEVHPLQSLAGPISLVALASLSSTHSTLLVAGAQSLSLAPPRRRTIRHCTLFPAQQWPHRGQFPRFIDLPLPESHM